MERRNFLRTAAAVAAAPLAAEPLAAEPLAAQPLAAGATAAPAAAITAAEAMRTTEQDGMKYRVLGNTGERVSLVGLGGFHLAKPGPRTPSEQDAIRIVHAAVDAGINFCDNCWDYNEGESEIRLGKALRGGYRQKVFLMTKLDGRTAQAASGQLETSLRRLQTDHIDLIQFHEIIRMEDPGRIFAQGGALEAMLRARDQGKVRHIGFTGHKSPAIHRHMFEVADRHGFRFDTAQMPINVMDAHYDSFLHGVVPVALAHGTATLAMKTFGDPFIFQAHAADPLEMLHFSMSQPVSVVICGCDQMAYLRQAIEAVRSFAPMSEAAQAALLDRSAAMAANGQTERYKISSHFDGTVQHPHWLEQA